MTFPDLNGTPITLGAQVLVDGYSDKPATVVAFSCEDGDFDYDLGRFVAEPAAVIVRCSDGSVESIERDPLHGPWDDVAFSEIVVQTGVVV